MDLLNPLEIKVPTIIAIIQEMTTITIVRTRMLFACATMTDCGTMLQSMMPERPIFS